jgi:DNA-binding NarL/FixJ family response regulator
MLRERPEFQVSAEASDGFAAVQMAEELQPDLILLDIGLPKLNGIEAAKRIHLLVPGSAILFLTMNNNVGVVQAALSNGAKGYVLKLDAEKELCPAIEAILQGKQFVSSGLHLTEMSRSLLKRPL